MATNRLPAPLISAEELAAQLHDPQLRVVDASWHMPATGRNGAEEFLQRHLPGAIFFDIDAVSDPNTGLPHMLPAAEDFAQAVGALGIGNDSHVVVYDAAGLFSAARLWWMFRVFGHDHVSVLDGGLPAWQRAGLPTASGAAPPTPAIFTATRRAALLQTRDTLLHNLDTQEVQVVDARSTERFSGNAAEPRAGLRSGHIPHSMNIPFTETLHADGTMKSAEALAQLFRNAGWSPDKPTAASCGSGVTACILALALARMGYPDTAIYDGSWAEWGADDACPVATS